MEERKKDTPDLRVAVISDLHLGFIGHINENYYGLGQIGDQDKWWEYALRYFKDKGVDVVVVPGDMANACDYSVPCDSAKYAIDEITRCVKIFKKVFDGTDTRLVCVNGNHDRLAQELEKYYGGDKTVWEDVFNEPYAPVFCKEIKGYSFVGVNWYHEKDAKEITAQAVRRSPDKPVFYIQHGEIKRTTCDTYGSCLNGGVGMDNIAEYENVIALFGHTHCPITDERTIWQSDEENGPKCTVISCGTFNYADGSNGLINGENLQTKHALYLTVKDMDIRIERLSFWTDEMIALATGEKNEQTMGVCTRSAGSDWRFTLGGERVMGHRYRAKRAIAPEFPQGAVAGLSRGDTFAVVSFPSAIPPKGANLLRSYYVEAWDSEEKELVSKANLNTESHVDCSAEHFAKYYHVVVPNLQPNTVYLFKVFARDSFGNLSEKPLLHKGRTCGSPYVDRLR